jgi:hypothetical protein
MITEGTLIQQFSLGIFKYKPISFNNLWMKHILALNYVLVELRNGDTCLKSKINGRG